MSRFKFTVEEYEKMLEDALNTPVEKMQGIRPQLDREMFQRYLNQRRPQVRPVNVPRQ